MSMFTFVFVFVFLAAVFMRRRRLHGCNQREILSLNEMKCMFVEQMEM